MFCLLTLIISFSMSQAWAQETTMTPSSKTDVATPPTKSFVEIAKERGYETPHDTTVEAFRMMRASHITTLDSQIQNLNNADFYEDPLNSKKLLHEELEIIKQSVLAGNYYGTYSELLNFEQLVNDKIKPPAQNKIVNFIDKIINTIETDTTPITPAQMNKAPAFPDHFGIWFWIIVLLIVIAALGASLGCVHHFKKKKIEKKKSQSTQM